MSTNDVAGMAIGGEFNAANLLKLLSYEPPRYQIPAKIRKAFRNLKKTRGGK